MNKVLLCGFPKTGNTWVRFIVMNYCNILNHGAEKTLTYEELIRIQRHRVERDVKGYKDKDYIPFKFDEGFPPVYHTHVSYNTKYGKHFHKFDKIVYILRNPYDTMISYYHYLTNRDKPFNGRHSPSKIKYLLNIDNFIKHYLSNFLTHVQETKSKADLVLYYDTLRTSPNGFKKLIELFGISVDDKILSKTIEMSSFESIREMGRNSKQRSGLSKNYKGEFTRDGRSGQYKEILSPDIIDYINKEVEKMRGY